MKKLLLLSMLAVSFQLIRAQDLKKVQTIFLLNKVEEAKTEVDKMLTDPKNQSKPDVLYWKAKISAAIYKDPKLREKYPNAEQDAVNAFKKYEDADPAFVQIKDKGADPYFDMYSIAFAQGVKAFNEKKWDDAGKYFNQALVYIDEVIKNKWTKENFTIDTTALLYAGYSYQNSSKPELAVKYYSRIADNKVAGPSYVDVYKYLALHYMNTNNQELFKKYVTIGRELYPGEPWDDFEVEFMDKNYDLAKKSEIYDKEDAAGTMSENKYLQFGDLFAHAKEKDKTLDSAKLASYSQKGADAFRKAYGKNPQNAIAAFNVGVLAYNIFGDYDDKYSANIRAMQALNTEKAEKPVEKDPKKKAAIDAKYKDAVDIYKKANTEMEKPLMDQLDMAMEWLEKSYNVLKDKATRTNTEKNVINKSVDYLANLYAYKRDRMKGKDPKSFDIYDAKYKEFDALHGKY